MDQKKLSVANTNFIGKKSTIYGNFGGLKQLTKNLSVLPYNNRRAFGTSGDPGWKKQTYCTRTSPRPKTADEFRILSFNIHNFHRTCNLYDTSKGKFVDNFRRKDPLHAIRTVSESNSDIVLFQEYALYMDPDDPKMNPNDISFLKNFYHVTGSVNTFGNVKSTMNYTNRLMENLGYEYFISQDDHQFHFNNDYMGKAIYGKLKDYFINVDAYNFKNSIRGALRSLVKIQNIYLLVYTVHLTFNNPTKTKNELKGLLNLIDADKILFGNLPVIIMGDFNNDIINSYSSIYKPELIDKGYKIIAPHDGNNYMKSGFNQGDTIDLIVISKDFEDKFSIMNDYHNESTTYPGVHKYDILFKSRDSDHHPIYIDLKPKPLINLILQCNK